MHFIVIKLHIVKKVFLFLLITIMLSIGVQNRTAASVFFGGTTRDLPVYNVETDENKVSLTFDAAWGADKTQNIIDLLKEYNAEATFFLVGFWVEDYPEMVTKIKDAGFEIGSHSNTHANLANVSKNKVKEELSISKSLIENATQTSVNLFRAPFGAYNNTIIEEARNLGMTTIQWDVDSLDWKGLSASKMAMRVISNVKPGSIILFHNNADCIIEGLRLVLDALKNKGYKFSSVGNLLIKDNYYIDSQGKQRKK